MAPDCIFMVLSTIINSRSNKHLRKNQQQKRVTNNKLLNYHSNSRLENKKYLSSQDIKIEPVKYHFYDLYFFNHLI